MPPKAEFWDPYIKLPYSLRNTAELFEGELAWCARTLPAPSTSELIGMMDRIPESFYDLLPSTSSEADSRSSSTRSSHPS